MLDLDETLVHSRPGQVPEAGCDFSVEVRGGGDKSCLIHVRKRPHVREFLERAAELFEVVVFTAGQQAYADQVLDMLDPQGTLIHHRIYRPSCVLVEGRYLKDLSILGRDLRQTLLVDNSPHAFLYQLNNGVPIVSFYDSSDDRELMKLLPFLESLVDVEDVRTPIKDKYKLHQVIQELRRLHAEQCRRCPAEPGRGRWHGLGPDGLPLHTSKRMRDTGSEDSEVSFPLTCPSVAQVKRKKPCR